jgi:hypothetical protein
MSVLCIVTALPAHTMEAMNKIPVFDIVSCELCINPKRQYSVEKYFKMVVSIPDVVESPTYGWFVKKYTESAFSTSKDSGAVNKVRSRGINIFAKMVM